MGKGLIFLVFFCSGGLAFAQQVDNYRQDTTTLYQRAKGFSTDPIRSKWRQEVKKEGNFFVLNLYDKKDVLQEKISFADKHLLERKGAYLLFQNGNVKEEGNYNKGYKVGEWKSYYVNKQLLEKKNYVWDKLHGSRKLFYKDGKLALDETYERDRLLTGAYFDPQGKTISLAEVLKALL
ncbi:MAG: hypothetical protein V4663_05795 [Bacteroidota bacterium]